MEQSQNLQLGESKPKAPVFVIIIAWLMLLGGIGSLLFTASLLFIGGIGKSSFIFGWGGITLVKGIGLVVLSFGIRQMRRWALYTLTALTMLGVVISMYLLFAIKPAGSLTDFADVGLQALVLAYFWAISKRFV
ncbi:MAG: hypothetical protein WC862_02375 [Patescibacteria group bacterium]